MREDLIRYGEVSDELCANCGGCSDYELFLKYNYTKFLFVSLFERNRKYFLRCKNCRAYSQIAQPKAKYMIDAKFCEFERKRKRKLRIKNAISLLLIGAAVFGVAAGLLYDPDMAYKKLVEDKPDGYYEIYDKEGKLWVRITKSGSARYDLLVKREKYTEERAAAEAGMYYEDYYSEQNGDLKYIEDNASILLDKNGVYIRYYFYDTEEKDIFYSFGVDDLRRIAYTEDRALYPVTYYSDENEYYWKVYEKDEGREMILLFKDTKGTKGNAFANVLNMGGPDCSGDRLQTAEIYTLDNGIKVKYEYYDFTGTENLSPVLAALNRQSTLGEAVLALGQSGAPPLYNEGYEYYKDTKVIKSAVTVYQDAAGLKVTDYVYYDIEEKGGYYIVTEKKNKLPESTV